MSTQDSSINIYKERIFPILFMLIVTVVFIALVSGIHLATRENVLRNEQLYLKRAVLFAADIPVPDGNQEIENLYNQSIREKRDADGNVQPGGDGWMVAGSRLNHNGTTPPTITIKVYHFTGVQTAAAIQSVSSDGTSGGGGGGCFIQAIKYKP